jgi:hypothetical protein
MTFRPTFPTDFNLIRQVLIREVVKVTGLQPNQVVVLEPETQNEPRPAKPYFGMKITTPSAKTGDDSKQWLGGTRWNSGGVRQMTVGFDCYGTSHEEAYNYMSLWQTALDLEDIQADLRQYGIAVSLMTTVADLSALLNTGFEGRAHLDVIFNIAMNLSSDLGAEESVEVQGAITTDQDVVIDTDQTIESP